jgi:DNA-directed RNA polymerase specialized sigma54-like protein
MNNDSTQSKLQELLKELDDLHNSGVVTKDEHECLRIILNYAYGEDNLNNANQSLSLASNMN